MRISVAGGPRMSVGVLRLGFLTVRIPKISEGYQSAFQYAGFLACPSMCSNTRFPILNFLFMLIWKSKVVKLFVTTM